MLAQACIRYDAHKTLILIRMFAGRIILVCCIVILKFVTMTIAIYGRRRLNFETLTQ